MPEEDLWSFWATGVPVSRDALKDLMTVPYSFAPAHLDRQRAAAVAALAWSYYQEEGGRLVWYLPMISVPVSAAFGTGEQEHSERRSFSLLLEK